MSAGKLQQLRGLSAKILPREAAMRSLEDCYLKGAPKKKKLTKLPKNTLATEKLKQLTELVAVLCT